MLSGSVFSNPAPPERMLVVLFPHWPIVVHAKARDHAGAVVEHNRIVAASPLADRRGVAIGQRLREAERLSPGLLVFHRDPKAEFHAFAPIVHALAEIAPECIVRDPGWIGLATRGPARYFGGEHGLVARIDEELRLLMAVHGEANRWKIGIADGPFGATLAAREGAIVDPGGTPAFLSDFPVSLIDDPALSALLERLGIKTLGAFARLRPEDVLARFGVAGFQAYQHARANDSSRQIRYRTEEEIACVQSIDDPVVEVETLVRLTRDLADAFCERLEQSGLRCTICELSAVRSDAGTNTRLWQRNRGWDARAIAERMRWQLSAWSTSQGDEALEESRSEEGVVSLSIRASEVIDAQGNQLGFWDQSDDRDEAMERVCMRLEGLLGQHMVMQVQLVGGRAPVDRVAYRPFGERLDTSLRRSVMPWPGQLPPPSPALVYSEAPEISLFDLQGEPVSIDRRGMLHGRPAQVALPTGSATSIVGWSGPWPIEERWWDRRRATRRARLQLLLVDQRVLLVGCTRGRWHLEGEYD